MFPMFQGPFTQTEQLGKFALRKGDPLPDRLDINVIWDVYFTAVILPALGECERFFGTRDHSLACRRFRFLHRDSPLGPVGLDYIRQDGFQYPPFFRRQIGLFVLGKDIEQEYRNPRPGKERDYPVSPAFPLAFSSEPHFSSSARSLDHITGLRIGGNPRDNGTPRSVGQSYGSRVDKECGCLHHGLHNSVYSAGVYARTMDQPPCPSITASCSGQ